MLRRAFLVTILATAAATVLGAPDERVILVLGDSISAGYGLTAGSGWVTLLQQRLAVEPRDFAEDPEQAVHGRLEARPDVTSLPDPRSEARAKAWTTSSTKT